MEKTIEISVADLVALKRYWMLRQLPSGQILDIAKIVDEAAADSSATGERDTPHWPPNKLG